MRMDDQGKVEDPGISDERMFVYESEFASALAVMKWEGNTFLKSSGTAGTERFCKSPTRTHGQSHGRTHLDLG